MKKIILIAAGAILALLMAAAGILLYVWHRYEMPQIVGDTVESERSDLEEISWRWFSQYFDQFDGWLVPYDYRVVNARIENMEILTDLEMPCIQIDYEIYTAGSGSGIVQALDLHMLEQVCIWLRQRLDQGRKIAPVSINQSRSLFLSQRYCDTFINILDKYGIPRDLVTVEITEIVTRTVFTFEQRINEKEIEILGLDAQHRDLFYKLLVQK